MKVFVDTSAFIGILANDDPQHIRALEKRKHIQEKAYPLFTSNLILYETLTWIAIKKGTQQAVQFGRGIWQKSQILKILYLTEDDELMSLSILNKYKNLPLSFADASTIWLMHKHHLDSVFTFDAHFRKANLRIL